MSIFGSIKDAIFGRARAAQQAASPQPRASGGVGLGAQASAMPQMGQQAQQPVDVEQVLTALEREKGSNLNWRTSIVDLMKLLDLDSSLSNRSALATELGYTGARDGSAEMNLWLHRRVMDELEKNGGRVPAGLKG